ncbi:MAG: cache domain-containing protein [Ignavibacteriales bacterium]|nr:cache domain-containing protein [Ignavibacteriales bacterium]
MRKLLAFVLMALVVVGTTTARQKKGTSAEAEALVKKAIAFVKANGKDKAFAEFSDPKGKFVVGDLYVFVYDLTGKCVAHGGNQKMIGKDLIEMKDADGKSFVKERVEIAKTKGSGWQNYKWNNPTTSKIEDKTAYIEKTDDVIIGCGAYKQ